MALILNIESSSNICSVALSEDGITSGFIESDEDKSHAGKLTLFIEELFKNHNISIEKVDAIAVSQGPGSYTGLRIGVSVAKGMCYAMNKPLIAIDTLQALTHGLLYNELSESSKHKFEKDTLFCPMIDARRMEVYTAIYTIQNKRIGDVKAEIINKDSFRETLNNSLVVFFGNGSNKCKELIKHKNAIFVDNIYLSARFMSGLAETAFNKKEFCDTAYFEPFYLKDFIATTPKKNILFK